MALGFAFSFANDISMNSSNAVKLMTGGFFEFFALSRVGSVGPVPEVDLNMWLPSQRILKANSIQFLSFGSFGIPAENVAPRWSAEVMWFLTELAVFSKALSSKIRPIAGALSRQKRFPAGYPAPSMYLKPGVWNSIFFQG